MKNFVIKTFALVALMVYAVGSIGGVGYAIYSHAYFVGVCVFFLGVMAFPVACAFFDLLLGNNNKPKTEYKPKAKETLKNW